MRAAIVERLAHDTHQHLDPCTSHLLKNTTANAAAEFVPITSCSSAFLLVSGPVIAG